MSLNAPQHRPLLPPMDHASLGVGNISTARKFYDPIFEQLYILYLEASECYAS